MKRDGTRALIEIGFILFLFYTNLLMGEFEGSGMGQKKGLLWAMFDVFTTRISASPQRLRQSVGF